MSNPVDNGTFSFSLARKVDRDGKAYLFAGLRMFGVVVFVRPEEDAPTDDEGHPLRWRAVVKPYTGSSEVDWPDSPDSESHQSQRKKP